MSQFKFAGLNVIITKTAKRVNTAMNIIFIVLDIILYYVPLDRNDFVEFTNNVRNATQTGHYYSHRAFKSPTRKKVYRYIKTQTQTHDRVIT